MLDDSWYGGQIGLTSVSNDFFVLWRSTDGSYLHYHQYDAIPLTPQNLNVHSYVENGITYPKLTWSLSNEPDVRINDDAYLLERRVDGGQGWGNWYLLGPVSGNISQYVDYDCRGIGSERYLAEFRMRAKDISNHLSNYSSSIFWSFEKYVGNKIAGELKRFTYQLEQNYPNPFNPVTTIDYSIQKAGEVSFKVYDMLGIEVASLVNENQEAGNYSIEFNAAELPSGIYVYRLASGNFMETKKLVLLK
ncbi:MAG: hypothetical protein DAHOPDDO_03086 [Ignavibacteriaceae bacterium]|nr:hypothetical protein [Ignavibacteriaceae bacterium]